jgi:hypothetical protein
MSARASPHWAEIDRIERAAAEAWRSADTMRDDGGNRIALRRSAEYLVIEVPGGTGRFSPTTLRAIAAVMVLAARDIEAGR